MAARTERVVYIRQPMAQRQANWKMKSRQNERSGLNADTVKSGTRKEHNLAALFKLRELHTSTPLSAVPSRGIRDFKLIFKNPVRTQNQAIELWPLHVTWQGCVLVLSSKAVMA